MGRNAQKRRAVKSQRVATHSNPADPQMAGAPDPNSPEAQAWAAFQGGAQFQQMCSEVVSHTEESISHLEGMDEPRPEWAEELLEQYYEELPELRKFYAEVRRYVNESGHDVLEMLNPMKPAPSIIVPEAPGIVVP